jgi:hypothetical protein
MVFQVQVNFIISGIELIYSIVIGGRLCQWTFVRLDEDLNRLAINLPAQYRVFFVDNYQIYDRGKR